MGKKKHPTEEQKQKLDNTKVPNLTVRSALRSMSKGDFKEADRKFVMARDAALKEAQDKKKK